MIPIAARMRVEDEGRRARRVAVGVLGGFAPGGPRYRRLAPGPTGNPGS